jgi:hypothetical protein
MRSQAWATSEEMVELGPSGLVNLQGKVDVMLQLAGGRASEDAVVELAQNFLRMTRNDGA